MNKIKTKIFLDHCFDKSRLKKWISKIYQDTLAKEDVPIIEFIEGLKDLGFAQATKAGISIGIDDLRIPPKKRQFLREIEYDIQQNNKYYSTTRITALENFQNFIDNWHRTSEILKLEVVANFEATDTLNPVYMMAFSGARGNLSQVSQLVGMRGFMSDPEGQIIDYPIRSNFREGLTLTEYIISCYGARKGLVDTALRTADAGYLTRRLVDVAHGVIITSHDCKTHEGVWLKAMRDNGKVLYSLEKRLIGRVLAKNLIFAYHPDPDQIEKLPKKVEDYATFKKREGLRHTTAKPIYFEMVRAAYPKLYERLRFKYPNIFPTPVPFFSRYFKRNQQLDPARAKFLALCFERVFIRSPLRCKVRNRLCQLCYGWTLPHVHLAPIGEAVGVLAAQSIGEPGTQLTMRTFHTGGVFSGALSEETRAPYSGIIQYNDWLAGGMFRLPNGKIAFLTLEPGQLKILSKGQDGAYYSSYQLNFPAESILFFKNRQAIQKGAIFIEFPKQEESEKETVSNIYTHYSRRAGLLKIRETNSLVNNNEELIYHKKVPAINPFFDIAKKKDRNRQVFTLFAGQLLYADQIRQFLPKKGDLLSNRSVVSVRTLLTPKLVHFTRENNLEKTLQLTRPILRISGQPFKFSLKTGYTSQIETKISHYQNYLFRVSHLKISDYSKNPKITLSPTNKLENGKFFLPVANFKLIKSKFPILASGKNEKKNLTYQKKATFEVESSNSLKNISYLSLVFKDSENQTSLIFSRGKTKKSRSNQNQSNGFLISQKQQTLLPSSKVMDLKDFEKSRKKWVKDANLSLPQITGQKLEQKILPKNYGLWTKNPPISLENLTLKYRYKKLLKKPYWSKTTRLTYKTGWPSYSAKFQKSCCDYLEKIYLATEIGVQFHSFSNQVIYSEFFFQAKQSLYGTTELKTRTMILSKSKITVFDFEQDHAILLNQKSSEKFFRLFQKSSPQIVSVKTSLLKNEDFEFFKKNQFLLKNSQFKAMLANCLFDNLNRLEVGHSKPLQLKKEAMQVYFLNENFLDHNFIDLQKWSPSLRTQTLLSLQNGAKLSLKLFTNACLKNVIGDFSSSNIFKPFYCYSLQMSLRDQNYLTTNEIDPSSFYFDKNLRNQAKRSLNNVFFSQYGGEFLGPDNESNKETAYGLTLTEEDSFTVSAAPELRRKSKLGRIYSYDNNFILGQAFPYVGKLIYLTKDFLQFQVVEKFLVAGNAQIHCGDQEFIEKNNRLFSQSYPRLQMGDIVQGIPKIEEFFEARQTKNGIPFEGNLHERLKNRFEFYNKQYQYPFPVATKKSLYDIQQYIIESIFKLYNSQGIDISDKHLEVIVRQMTSKVRLTEYWYCHDKHAYRDLYINRKYTETFRINVRHPLPSELYPFDLVQKFFYKRVKPRLFYYSQYAVLCYEPAILGITKASLETGGFISAASFQETTRILSRAALFQKQDFLKGLKQNIVLGHIIPAGTAVRLKFRRYYQWFNSSHDQYGLVATVLRHHALDGPNHLKVYNYSNPRGHGDIFNLSELKHQPISSFTFNFEKRTLINAANRFERLKKKEKFNLLVSAIEANARFYYQLDHLGQFRTRNLNKFDLMCEIPRKPIALAIRRLYPVFPASISTYLNPVHQEILDNLLFESAHIL